jgi:hypothetical protein
MAIGKTLKDVFRPPSKREASEDEIKDVEAQLGGKNNPKK